MRRTRIVVTATIAATFASMAGAEAQARWPHRLFTVFEPQARETVYPRVRDAVETADGTLVLATVDSAGRAAVVKLGRDGRATTLADYTGDGPLERAPAIGLAADQVGGGVLVVQAFSHRIERVALDGSSSLLAGTGRAGLGGDGGPATAADLDPGDDVLAGIAPARSGSIFFTDGGNGRIRSLRPDGTVETVAGNAPALPAHEPCAPFGGEGGPATAAALCEPTDVLATADGGIVVADAGNNRIRRIAPDGSIRTIAGRGAADLPVDFRDTLPAVSTNIMPVGLAEAPNGDILFSQGLQIWRLTTEGRLRGVLNGGGDPFSGRGWTGSIRDFAGRGISGWPAGLAVTREGGVLLGGNDAYYLAPRDTQRTLVRIGGARAGAGPLMVRLTASRPALARVVVRRDGRTIARTARHVRAGRTWVRVSGPFAPAWHAVHVTVNGFGGARARDSVGLHLGRSLAMRDVRVVAEQSEDEAIVLGCRRFGPRRIDCVYGYEGWCDDVWSFSLKRTGVLWGRAYGCRDRDIGNPFQRDPDWQSEAAPAGR